jgi:hypothetical protein
LKFWNLEFICHLEFGTWDLAFGHYLEFGTWNLKPGI